jgi:hypothetical protein
MRAPKSLYTPRPLVCLRRELSVCYADWDLIPELPLIKEKSGRDIPEERIL